MVVKSKGIVLGYLKYGDNSIIVRVFTQEYGYGSYIVNSIRSQKSKKSIGFFQPFSMLELVMYVKETRDLQRISEFKNYHPLHRIHSDPIKNVVTLFLTEVFSKLLQSEQSSNPQLYTFAEESIKEFDLLEEAVANFHLQFLLKVGPYLGFAIDEIESLFSSTEQTAPTSEQFHRIESLMHDPYGTKIEMNRTTRNEILDAILNYYMHHAHIPRPKSLNVLRSILN